MYVGTDSRNRSLSFPILKMATIFASPQLAGPASSYLTNSFFSSFFLLPYLTSGTGIWSQRRGEKETEKKRKKRIKGLEEVNLMCASVAQIFFSISRVIFVIKKVTLGPRIYFLRVRGCEKYKDLIDTYLCRKVGNGKKRSHCFDCTTERCCIAQVTGNRLSNTRAYFLPQQKNELNEEKRGIHLQPNPGSWLAQSSFSLPSSSSSSSILTASGKKNFARIFFSSSPLDRAGCCCCLSASLKLLPSAEWD